MSTTLLTTSETARVFQVEPETVTEWARQGRIPVVRISRKTLRFRQDVIERMARGERVSTRKQQTA